MKAELHILATSIGLFFSFLTFAQDSPPVAPNVQTIKLGSLIIPMDEQKQSLNFIDPTYFINFQGFNLASYGLIYCLLDNGIPVKWIIRAGKFKDEPDFTANVSREYPTPQGPVTRNFTSGAFVISYDDVVNESCSEATSSLLALVDSVIIAFDHDVAVYRLNQDKEMDVRYSLTYPPTISVLSDGGLIDVHTNLLAEASIPHDTLSSADFFLDYSCYTFISQPHLDVINNPDYIPSLNNFLANGGNFLAQCISALVFENAGHFQSTDGFFTDEAFDNNNYFYYNNDMPIMQFEGPLPKQIEGSLTNYILQAGTYKPGTYTCVANQSNELVITASDINGILPGGNVFYIAGHEADLLDFENYLLQIGNMPTAMDFRRVQQLKKTYLNAAFVPAGINFACAGNDVCICPGESAILGCPGLVTGPGINYSWFPTVGLSCSDCPNPIASPEQTTSYTMTVSTGLGSGCAQPSTVTVRVNDGVEAINIAEQCDSLGFFYVVSFELVGGDQGSYQVNGDSGTLAGNVFTSAPIASAADYLFEVSDSNECVFTIFGSRNCCLASVSLSGGGEICEASGETATINFSLEGEGPWELIYSINGNPEDPIFASESLFSIETVVGGLYEIYSISDANCEGEATDFVEVILQPAPVVELGSGLYLCEGEPLILDAGNSGANYLWQDGSTSSELTVYDPGVYEVTVSNACGYVRDRVVILEEFSVPSANFGEDRSICRDSILVLDATFEGSSYTWQDGSTNARYFVREPGNYSVTVNNNCGSATESVQIDFFTCLPCNLYIPNAFSPNFDGINDKFSPIGNNCVFVKFEFQVFDRWGSLAFESSDPNVKWDGLKNGEFWPIGVYVWVLNYKVEFMGEILNDQVSGDVTLLR